MIEKVLHGRMIYHLAIAKLIVLLEVCSYIAKITTIRRCIGELNPINLSSVDLSTQITEKITLFIINMEDRNA